MYYRGLTKYLIAFSVTIALGLLSRKINYIPPIAGDILYASMAYWMCRGILIRKPLTYALYGSILFCFGIEFLQLVQWSPLIWVRQHQLLRLVFGQGFLWTDLLAYCIGASIAYLIDRSYIKWAQ